MNFIVQVFSLMTLDNEEIRAVLKRSGLNPKIVDSLEGVIDQNVPVYLPRLLKMESQLRSLIATAPIDKFEDLKNAIDAKIEFMKNYQRMKVEELFKRINGRGL